MGQPFKFSRADWMMEKRQTSTSGHDGGAPPFRFEGAGVRLCFFLVRLASTEAIQPP
jgi:hypothetical protein